MDLRDKCREVCIKARSSPASLPFKGQFTEETTVKWSVDTEGGWLGSICHLLHTGRLAMQPLRPSSDAILHILNQMQMRKILCSPSFAFDLARV